MRDDERECTASGVDVDGVLRSIHGSKDRDQLSKVLTRASNPT